MVKLNYSKNTIGCNVGGKIFIHPDLHKHPKLFHAIVEHEKKHSNTFTGEDIALDIFNDDLKGHKKSYYKFLLTHPRALLGFLPITKLNKTWAVDIEITILWLFSAILFYFAWFVL